jgi:fructosamine-3-kinase
LDRLESVRPDAAAAREFGRRLAITHDAGAAGFGAPPDGWTRSGYFGPAASPLPMSLTPHGSWGEFYAQERLGPACARAADDLPLATRRGAAEVIDRCHSGRLDDGDRPARLHGDLWSGNVMWTAGGVVLIDPAAHGGHRETDLAMLALFGCPHLDDVLDGYERAHPLRAGWRQRRGLHQLYPLLMHVALFGRSYASGVSAAVDSALDITS